MSLTPLISQLMLERGRAQGSALSQIGQSVEQIPQQMERQQQLELQRQQMQQQMQIGGMQLSELQQKQSDMQALDYAFRQGDTDAILKSTPGHLRLGVQKSLNDANESAAKMNEANLALETATTGYINTGAQDIKAHGYDPIFLQGWISHATQTPLRNNPQLMSQLSDMQKQLHDNPTPETVQGLIDPILKSKEAGEKPLVIPPTPRGGAPAQVLQGTTVIATGSPTAPTPMDKNQALTYLSDINATGAQKDEATKWLAADKDTQPTQHVNIKTMEGGKPVERVMTVQDAIKHGSFESQPPAAIQVNNQIKNSNLPAFALTGDRPTHEEGNIPDRTIGMTPNQLFQAALSNIVDNTLPARGMGQNPLVELQREAIGAKVGAISEATGLDKPTLRMIYLGNKASFVQQQKNADNVESFIKNADQNAALLRPLLDQIPDTGSKWLNVPVRDWDKNALSDPVMSKVATYLASVQAEYGKIINSGGANLSSVLTDSARHEAQDLIDKNQTAGAQLASLEALQKEGGNRLKTFADQLHEIVLRQQNIINPDKTVAPQAPAGTGTVNPFRPAASNPFRPQP